MNFAVPAIDYAETGSGPTVLLLPGSLSTAAAWKPIMSALSGRFRFVTTSLLGNGATAEQRGPGRVSIALQADALEHVALRAGGAVHVVSHSYGAIGLLALALRGTVPIASLTLIEANPADVLRQSGDLPLYNQFRTMSDAYVEAFGSGEIEAVSRVVDFYDGPGTFAALPPRVREHLVTHTASNILDWASMYGFDVPLEDYARITAPTVIVRGMKSHPGMQRIGEVLRDSMARAVLVSIQDAGHFMLPTHPQELSNIISGHVAHHR
jgi:pimeloyl-ACP methyl ester carboxylesterase